MGEILQSIESSMASFFQQLAGMQITDYLDILCVALVFYMLAPLVRSTGALRIAKVVLALLVVTWLTDVLDMHTMNWLLDQVLAVGLVAVVVLFQPELRRMLDQISNIRMDKLLGLEQENQEMDEVIAQTVLACDHMSRQRVGALIVFARDMPLDEYCKSGTALDARVSEQLLRNIFFPKAALHDGAMIIRDGRVAAAGCVLPLTNSNRLSADLGTRHRAGVGMSEVTDAVVVIISEETGTISVAIGGMLKRHLPLQTLEQHLRQELCKSEDKRNDSLAQRLRQRLQNGKEGGKDEK